MIEETYTVLQDTGCDITKLLKNERYIHVKTHLTSNIISQKEIHNCCQCFFSDAFSSSCDIYLQFFNLLWGITNHYVLLGTKSINFRATTMSFF
jgi:hypothetical protein